MRVVRCSAENWPQWRGPSLNGISAEKNLPVKWSTTENIAWKLPMPALVRLDADRLGRPHLPERRRALPDTARGDSLHLWCVDRAKGTVLWKRPLGGGNQHAAQAEHVVAVAGDRRHATSG